MLAAFLAIAVEQGVAGLPMKNPVELPDENSDIANALAHALADEGRLLMRGIAGEEDAAAPPFPWRPTRETGSSPHATALLHPA